jgi:hypothetical protein
MTPRRPRRFRFWGPDGRPTGRGGSPYYSNKALTSEGPDGHPAGLEKYSATRERGITDRNGGDEIFLAAGGLPNAPREPTIVRKHQPTGGLNAHKAGLEDDSAT